MNNSSQLWQDVVWPLVQHTVRGGDLVPLEVLGNETAQMLDVMAGIDGFQVHPEFGLRGIAHRAQLVTQGRSYDSFTIRMSRASGHTTEFEKRVKSIDAKAGWLFPALTIQSYATAWVGPVVAVGVARTIDIIQFVRDGHHYTRNVTSGGSATFAVCDWHKMKDCGYTVRIVRPNGPLPPSTMRPFRTHSPLVIARARVSAQTRLAV